MEISNISTLSLILIFGLFVYIIFHAISLFSKNKTEQLVNFFQVIAGLLILFLTTLILFIFAMMSDKVSLSKASNDLLPTFLQMITAIGILISALLASFSMKKTAEENKKQQSIKFTLDFIEMFTSEKDKVFDIFNEVRKRKEEEFTEDEYLNFYNRLVTGKNRLDLLIDYMEHKILDHDITKKTLANIVKRVIIMLEKTNEYLQQQKENSSHLISTQMTYSINTEKAKKYFKEYWKIDFS